MEERTKRQKGPNLSDLTMDVLCNILSRVPIRQAIRTSALSKQLKHVWRHHTNLIFNRYTMRKTRERISWIGSSGISDHDFISRVDGVLRQHAGAGVVTMSVSCTLDQQHARHVDAWVEFTLTSKAKELALNLSDSVCSFAQLDRPTPYRFPCRLFFSKDNAHLQCLQLTTVSLAPSAGFGGFANLTKLALVDVTIADRHLEHLLSGCSGGALEFLEIAYCDTLTAVRARQPMNRLKHLQVRWCFSLRHLEINCCDDLTTLEYSGPPVPLHFSTTSGLRNVRLEFYPDVQNALDHLTTGFPVALPRLETLTLGCIERKRKAFLVMPPKFIHLRHLRLELRNRESKIDLLDYANVLDAAPFMETLEIHMWMDGCDHQPYRASDGELRALPLRQEKHTHLKTVVITGFFGHKDQVELALQILRSCTVLQAMKIDSRVKILTCGTGRQHHMRLKYVDGCMVAMEFVREADQNNVVEIAGAPPTTPLEATPT